MLNNGSYEGQERRYHWYLRESGSCDTDVHVIVFIGNVIMCLLSQSVHWY